MDLAGTRDGVVALLQRVGAGGGGERCRAGAALARDLIGRLLDWVRARTAQSHLLCQAAALAREAARAQASALASLAHHLTPHLLSLLESR